MEQRRRSDIMNCAEAEVMLHALVDGELDAGHAREVERHVVTCARCSEQLEAFRTMRAVMAGARLKETAPASLRSRIEQALPAPSGRVIDARQRFQPTRRSFFGGFTAGAVASGVLAASLMLTVFEPDQNLIVADKVVSAHIRSLQPGHLMDVETSDQHTVKPWFDGKVDVAPPVIDLTAEGFTLLGGRLDYIDGEPVASVVYRRRKHIINLFVARHLGTGHAAITARAVQGYNVRHWSEQGLEFWAVSDLDGEELREFVGKISAALWPKGASS
jgi:anti-sigma factor RsiW